MAASIVSCGVRATPGVIAELLQCAEEGFHLAQDIRLVRHEHEVIRLRDADDARVRKGGLECLRYGLALRVQCGIRESGVRKRIDRENWWRDLRVALHPVEDRRHEWRQLLLLLGRRPPPQVRVRARKTRTSSPRPNR